MYTQCPGCRTIFEIDEEALQASFGIVHCGHCAKRFDALRSLSNTLPLEPGVGLPELADGLCIPTLTSAVSAATMEAAVNKYRWGRPTTSGSPEPDPVDPAAAVAAATDDDDWFDALQADLAVEAGRAQPPPVPMTPHGDLFDPADELGAAPFSDVDAPAAPAPAAPEDGSDSVPVRQASHAADVPGTTAAAETPLHAPTPGDHTDHSSTASAEPAPVDSAALGLVTADPAPRAAVAAATAETAESDSEPTPEPDHAPVAADAIPASTTPVPTLEPLSASTPPATAAGVDADPAASAELPDPPIPDPATLHGNVHMYVRPRRVRRSRAGFGWALGCAALVVLLALQIAWAERTALYLSPSNHAWMSRVCQRLACRLPPIHAPAKLALVARDIRPDPRRPGALSITATLRNDAGFREAWPIVAVVLTDIDNQPVAMRRFRPAEYMPDRARRNAGIPPGATVAVAFEVRDPGPRARGFQFTFE
ncbi:MAG TPA: DUF3426 domain-containing protein [Rhodanobacteraceae bacterium]|nr:DUF3426 domain-containing protein [Rhodanobacteraceae bacterium]